MSSRKIPPKVQQYLKQIDDLQRTYTSVVTQKQQLQLSVIEIKNALNALKDVPEDGEVFRLVGSIFFKLKKKQVVENLNEDLQLLEARIKSLETQENKIAEELNKLRMEVSKELSAPS